MLLLTHISHLCGIDRHHKPFLCGTEMQRFETLSDAFLLVDDGRFSAFGPMSELPAEVLSNASQIIDATGCAVMPSWCDPHTHIVYAGSREGEFVDKIRGLSYAEIARRGGGILNSADLLHDTDEDELYRQAHGRALEVMAKGTGCIEIKSGYGLNLDDELKMLRVIRRLRDALPMRIVSTFLGAHAVARGMSQEAYVDSVVNEMIPEVGRQQLADFVDVFCDEGFFTPSDTDRILSAAARWGMRPKIHAEELAPSGGVAVGVKHGALSVDHLESMAPASIEVLRQQYALTGKHDGADSPVTAETIQPRPDTPTGPPTIPTGPRPIPTGSRTIPTGTHTIPTALPGTSFFLNIPNAPARRIIEAGLPLAVASDYNPGSTPSGDMKFIVSLACIKLRLLPAEAFNAATLNAAAAMDLSRDYGSIALGKVANFFVTHPISSPDFIPYAYTTPLISRVFLRGREV